MIASIRKAFVRWLCRHGIHRWRDHGVYSFCGRCPARRRNDDDHRDGPAAWGW